MLIPPFVPRTHCGIGIPVPSTMLRIVRETEEGKNARSISERAFLSIIDFLKILLLFHLLNHWPRLHKCGQHL